MGVMASLGSLCPACFHAKPDNGRCSKCGWLDGESTTPPFHLPVRTVLRDNYILGKALGQGGFGITYVAWDPALQVRRAIKEYYPANCAARSPNRHTIAPYTGEAENDFRFGLDRFMEEARKLAKLRDHPHVVTVLEYFRENHTAYMVMDYLPGKTLENYLRDKGGRVPYAIAKNIMVRVTDALRSVHESNLLHRDVSPQNIYITDEGKVKLLDFGSARQTTGSQTHTLHLMIKHGYSPAEQYTKAGHQDAWTDVYATGATFYRAITGEVPPEAGVRGKSDPLRPISEFCDDVPKRAEKAILKALAVSPEKRFQTIKSFQDEIVAAGEIRKETPSTNKKIGTFMTWPKIVTVAAILSLVVAGILIYQNQFAQTETAEAVRDVDWAPSPTNKPAVAPAVDDVPVRREDPIQLSVSRRATPATPYLATVKLAQVPATPVTEELLFISEDKARQPIVDLYFSSNKRHLWRYPRDKYRIPGPNFRPPSSRIFVVWRPGTGRDCDPTGYVEAAVEFSGACFGERDSVRTVHVRRLIGKCDPGSAIRERVGSFEAQSCPSTR